jgi:hypothetical protein
VSTVTVPNLSNPATTFTPGLTFGGGATGMAFTTRQGVYRKIGDTVFFQIYLFLSAKGSSTGAALVTGLPFTQATPPTYTPLSLYLSGMSSLSGAMMALVQASTQTVSLYQLGTGGPTSLTHANFGNTSEVIVAGFMTV